MDDTQTLPQTLTRPQTPNLCAALSPASTTAHRIRQYRQALDWTQAALAEKVKTDAATVCDWERGRHAPSTASVRRLAVALNVHPALLLTWDD